MLAVIFISIVLFAAIDRFTASIKPLRENALRMELANIRSAVVFYAMTKGKLPPTLRSLVTENAIVTRTDIEGRQYNVAVLGKFVQSMSTDKYGNPTDPFGNPYAYDPSNGRVSSTTKGYERW